MWQPQSAHVSQLHHDGSGWNDCWEASLTRYLRECGTLDPAGDPLAQIAEVAQVVRGYADAPGNAPTYIDQCAASLAHYGLPASWTDDYTTTQHAYWAICLVDAFQLSPAQYDSSWLGSYDSGEGDHFILWLPQQGDQIDWFNDPLAYAYGEVDNQYDLRAVGAAFRGAYLLPSTEHGEAVFTVTRLPGPAHVAHHDATVRQACALKSQANHECKRLTWMPAGSPVTVIRDLAHGWSQVIGGRYVGYALTANLS